jgi:hypothetical protein
MKQMKKLLAISLVMFAFTAATFAQVTASSTAAAVIIAPLTISNTVGLHFGTAMRGASAGTVVLTPAGVRSATGGVTLSPLAPVATVASFTIDGEPGRAYTITIPTTDVTISDGGTNSMIVNTFASSPASGTYTPAGASTILTVGATLNVLANQASGTYNGTFNVSVNYN